MIAAPQQLARIVAVKNRDPGPVNQVLVSTVVYEHDALFG